VVLLSSGTFHACQFKFIPAPHPDGIGKMLGYNEGKICSMPEQCIGASILK